MLNAICSAKIDHPQWTLIIGRCKRIKNPLLSIRGLGQFRTSGLDNQLSLYYQTTVCPIATRTSVRKHQSYYCNPLRDLAWFAWSNDSQCYYNWSTVYVQTGLWEHCSSFALSSALLVFSYCSNRIAHWWDTSSHQSMLFLYGGQKSYKMNLETSYAR